MATTIVKPDYSGLNNTITQVPNSTTDYQADNGIYQTYFKQDGNAVTFTKGSRSIVWMPANISYQNQSGGRDVIYTVQQVPYDTKANYARINRSYPDIDDWFILEGNQMKHQILVQGFQRDPVLFLTGQIDFVVSGTLKFDSDLTVKANGLTLTGPFETEGQIDIYDGDNLLFTLPQVIAFDSAYERTETTGKYRVTQNAGGTLAFDIIVDNGWMSSTDRTYPIVIDPTIISNTSYKIATTSNVREMVKLSNGWLVIGTYYNNTIYLYVSKDSGASWQQLCTIAGSAYTNIPSLASTGTKVYVTYTMSSPAPATSYVVSFDATTVTNTDQSANKVAALVNPNSGSTYMNPEASISISASGIIGVAVGGVGASGSTTDVYYASSSDGGHTWSAAQKVSNTEPAGGHANHPCLIFDQNNSPVILFGWNNTTSNSIEGATIAYLNSGTWTLVTSIGSGNGLYSGSLQLAAGPDGTLYLIQSGADGGNGYYSIGFSKSTDNGRTWSAVSWLVVATSGTQTYVNPTIAIDPAKNDLYVFFEYYYSTSSPQYQQIRMIKFTAATNSWGSVTNITSNTTGSMITPTAIGGTYANMNATDAIYYAYSDSTNGLISASISIDQAPNAPTLSPVNGFDATKATTLSWTFSDPNAGDSQSAYQLQILDVAANSTVVDTGKVASTSSTYNLAAGTLTNGKQYQWRVMTWDQSGVSGPYSTYSSFNTAAPPSVTVTAPTAGQVWASNIVTAGWSYSDPANNPQQSYDVQLLDANGSVLTDTGTMQGSGNNQTIGYTLANNTTYQVQVTVTNSQGISATSAPVSFSTSFTTPNQLSLSYTVENAYYALTVSNPAGGQAVDHNDIYRRQHGTSAWTRIATGIAVNGTYNDYAVASNTQYDYYAVAVGTNSATSSTPSLTTNALSMTGLWVHDPTNPSGTITNIQYQTDFKKDEWKPSATAQQFAGRKKPVIQLGEQESNVLSAQKTAFLTSDANWPAVQALIKTKRTLCWRDGRGRKVFGVVLDMQNQDDSFGNVVDIEITEVDFNEAV